MSRRVEVSLTEAELFAILLAFSNVIDSCDEYEQVDFFGSKTKVRTAKRAQEKILKAKAEVTGEGE